MGCTASKTEELANTTDTASTSPNAEPTAGTKHAKTLADTGKQHMSR